MMKKLAFLFFASGLLCACVTKEDLKPELTEIPEKHIPITDFTRLQDSPTCIIPVVNYIDINTAGSILWDYGIKGDFDINTEQLDYDNFLDAADYYGNGRIRVDFGEYNTPATGIYYTSRYASIDEYEGKRYINIYLDDFNTWNTSYPSLPLKSGQKILVVVNKDKTMARIKICNAELEFNGRNNSGTVSGEILVHL